MRVEASPLKDKKYVAIFSDGTKTHFGQKGADDYTLTGDKDQRERYRSRHRKDLATKNPRKPGFLSYYLLWGSSTSLQQNIRDYKVRFGDKL